MPTPSLAHIVPAAAPQVSSSRRLLTPTTNPIPFLPTSTARYVAYAHIGIIPTYYYLRSTSLIRDPFSTLIQDLIPIATAQAAFCATCLPSAGAWNSGTKDGGKIIEGTAAATPKGAKGSKKRKGWKVTSTASNDEIWGNKIMPTLFSLTLTFGVPTIPLTMLALCLGAPLFPYNQIPLTFLLATHVSVLGFLPIFYTHGVSGSAWRDVAAAWLPFDEAGVWAATVGCFVGGWLGAIPIALDWDREWQKWPCTVIWGCVAGWTVGRMLTSVLRLGIGRRINLSETEGIPLDVLEEMEAEKKKS